MHPASRKSPWSLTSLAMKPCPHSPEVRMDPWFEELQFKIPISPNQKCFCRHHAKITDADSRWFWWWILIITDQQNPNWRTRHKARIVSLRAASPRQAFRNRSLVLPLVVETLKIAPPMPLKWQPLDFGRITNFQRWCFQGWKIHDDDNDPLQYIIISFKMQNQRHQLHDCQLKFGWSPSGKHRLVAPDGFTEIK